ncbi:transglutaminase-like cysteine peptidase [Defluviimonas sp. WL0075]|uniref:Transglutaminase-like cysteine peptidase n=1 Tax=Albidovulum sediminicola TaxID=2984331 RepID=A0ABT2Z0W9_9RHOB|nr:transglutaminase-like cysteine peptidase [Defluviimonas sp. WL0075]MCV2864793.1 transglutaminase-like cysteine peptidase [Defluviimonas sp. WL0075]
MRSTFESAERIERDGAGRGARLGAGFALALALVFGLQAAGPTAAAEGTTLTPRKSIAAPEGFGDVCARYQWACAKGSADQMNARALLKLAQDVNSAVNRRYRQVTDRRQYGTEEFWALPTSARGGDCEDFALAKKMSLIEAGVSPARLLIATVLDRKRGLHAVLVMRTEAGDFVLDNLRNRVSGWQDTGYTFLRMQDPSAPSRWQAVFAGGIFGRQST